MKYEDEDCISILFISSDLWISAASNFFRCAILAKSSVYFSVISFGRMSENCVDLREVNGINEIISLSDCMCIKFAGRCLFLESIFGARNVITCILRVNVAYLELIQF